MPAPALAEKVRIGPAHAPEETEADRIAEMLVPRAGPAQACGGCADGKVPCPACAAKRMLRLSRTPGAPPPAPAAVTHRLGGAGAPLPAAQRDYFEKRLGVDLGAVRVHADAGADRLARTVGARAFAIGNRIGFAAGEYRPGTGAGDRLLAHEVAHTLQDGAAMMLRRVCTLSPLPAAPIPIGAAVPFRYLGAERCLQTHYAATHAAKPGVSLSFNVDWMHLAGGTANEKAALDCLRGAATPGAGPNFTGKSGMFAGEPDIWDFRNQTMYEITTTSGAAFRRGKLGAELAQANAITAPFDCGGLIFDRGTWVPAGPLKMDDGLWITTANSSGVLIYTVIKDGTAELTAILLAMLASQLKKGGAGGAAGAVAKRAGPVYAIASLTAMAILLASGNAEAKPGPGEEPLVALYKALDQSGVTVSPEVQALIESKPGLKEKLEAAMEGRGDPSAAQAAIAEATLEMIRANPDQFSAEDLETLIAVQDAAAAAGNPRAPANAAELRAMLDALRRGDKPSSAVGKGGTGGGGAGGPAQPSPAGQKAAEEEGRKALEAATGPRRKVADALVASGSAGAGGIPLGAELKRLMDALPADLTDAEADKLLAQAIAPPQGATAADLVSQVAQAVAVMRGNRAATPGGMSAAQRDRLIAAAKTVPPTLPAGKFSFAQPDERQVGKTYGVVALGRSKDGKPYAMMSTWRIDAVRDKTVDGTLLQHTDGLGPDGATLVKAGTYAGKKVSTSLAPHP